MSSSWCLWQIQYHIAHFSLLHLIIWNSSSMKPAPHLKVWGLTFHPFPRFIELYTLITCNFYIFLHFTERTIWSRGERTRIKHPPTFHFLIKQWRSNHFSSISTEIITVLLIIVCRKLSIINRGQICIFPKNSDEVVTFPKKLSNQGWKSFCIKAKEEVLFVENPWVFFVVVVFVYLFLCGSAGVWIQDLMFEFHLSHSNSLFFSLYSSLVQLTFFQCKSVYKCKWV